MNITEAKAIPLAQILEKIGFAPAKTRKQEAMYFSPLRTEKTPSFQVNNTKNVWYDFGEGRGGNTLDFVCAYLASQQEANTVHDALRWIRNMAGSALVFAIKPTQLSIEKEANLIVKKVSAIQHRALTGYLAKRGIPLHLASSYLVQTDVYNRDSGKSFFALGMRNEEDSYELRNPFFKGSAGAKTISFVRGTEPKPNGIHIFEGMFDFLSLLAGKNIDRLPDDAIVLNSLSCLKQALPYIKNYGYRTAFTWLDNDKAGQKATDTLAAFFESEDSLRHQPMNKLYHPHKDVNEWHLHQLDLRKKLSHRPQ